MTLGTSREDKTFLGEVSSIFGNFILDRMPYSNEAGIIRKIAGLKKKPTITPQRREAMKDSIKSVRPNPTLEKVA